MFLEALSGLWEVVKGVAGYLTESKREKRREAREKIDGLMKIIEDVERYSYDYFSRDANDPECVRIGQMIRCSVKQAGLRAGHLNVIFPDARASTLYIMFRKAVTGGDFDSAQRTRRPPNDELFERISQCARNLSTSLETEFGKAFGRAN